MFPDSTFYRCTIRITYLCPAGYPRLYTVAKLIDGTSEISLSINTCLSGRGPIRDICPLITLISWGSSSIRALLINIPTLVIRRSSFFAHCAPSLSASIDIDLNLMTSNSLLNKPIRFCL